MPIIRKFSKYGVNRIIKDWVGLLYYRQTKNAYRFTEFDFWKLQIKKFETFYSYALANIPYYRQRNYPALDFSTVKSQSEFLALVEKVPVLRKSELKAHNHLFFNNHTTFAKIHTTSGTSGTPLELKANILEKGKLQMIKNIWFRKISGKLFPKLLILSGYFVPKNSGEFFFIDRFTGDIHLSIYALNDANYRIIANVLENEKPDLIYGYASAVNLLALVFQERPYSRMNGTYAVTTSENLEPHWRANCERYLVKKVFNFYSSQECVHGVLENENGLMQINPLMGLVEVLDNMDARVNHGLGRVVVTGFMRKSMPLIRYDIGDMMEANNYYVAPDSSPQWPVVGDIIGRAEDLVYKRDGSRIGYLCFHATKNIPEITEAQIIQEAYELFRCNLVVKDIASRKSVEEKIEAEVTRRLNAPVRIEFSHMDFIPRGKNEKFKAVVVNFKP